MAPPGVGSKKIIHNTRERVLSGDHNREQNVHDQMLAEILRCLTDPSYELDVAGGVEVNGTGSETLPRATIISGIRPRPEVGTINCFVEPGAICILDNPTPNADESKLAYVVDPGVQTAGALTLTPGSGGAIRIDVVECQRVETVIETDSRDIFDPSSGLFTPTLVNKVTTGRLVYRIRLGTPGLGFPGIAAGWLPLAVCSVPAAAVTWNDVTLWDVRPLYHERVLPPTHARSTLNRVDRHNVASDIVTAPAEVRVRGVVDISFGGYRAGGQLIHPGTTNEWIDVADTTLWAAGMTSANALWSLYLVFPFGLPRWVQYCPFTAGIREPRGQRGIPVISRWTAGFDGRPTTNLAQTQAWTGLLDPPTQNAICALAGLQDGSGIPAGIIGDGQVIHFVDNPGLATVETSSSGNDYSQFTFSDNVIQPGNARAVWIEFSVTFNFTVAGRVDIFEPSLTMGGPNNAYTNTVVVASESGPISMTLFTDTTGTPGPYRMIRRIPLPANAGYTGPRGFQVRWSHKFTAGSATWTLSARTIKPIGWELGP